MGITQKVGPARVTAFILLLLSFAMLIYSGISGDLELYLFLIFPVFRVNGIIGIISILLLMVGSVFLLISCSGGMIGGHDRTLFGPREGASGKKGHARTSRSEWGGVVFLGPFPVVFGNARNIEGSPRWWVLLIFWMVLSLVISLISILAIIILFGPW